MFSASGNDSYSAHSAPHVVRMTVSRTMRTGHVACMCTLRRDSKNMYGIQEAKGPRQEHKPWWADNINLLASELFF